MASLRELFFYAKKAVDEASDMASDSTSPPSAAGRKRIDVDEFMKAAIRMQVRDIFSCKEIPTAQKVLDACRKNISDFPQMSKSLLRAMGFRFKKNAQKRQLYESQQYSRVVLST